MQGSNGVHSLFRFVFDFGFHDGSVIELGCSSSLCIQRRQMDKQIDSQTGKIPNEAEAKAKAKSRKLMKTVTSTVSFKFDRRRQQICRYADFGKRRQGRRRQSMTDREGPQQTRQAKAKAGPIQTIRCEAELHKS